MAMAWLWTGMVAVSLVFGILTGSVGELGNAALEGATAAVELCVSMAGIMCLWTGVMEVMDQCGLSAALARLFRPLLRRLFPNASRDEETRAARRMAQGCGGTASHELFLLVVLNSASIQLLPTTVAGVRSALGSADPFDILPTVWTASLLSVLAGLAAAKLFARIWRG